jgi:hypothetical protein
LLGAVLEFLEEIRNATRMTIELNMAEKPEIGFAWKRGYGCREKMYRCRGENSQLYHYIHGTAALMALGKG